MRKLFENIGTVLFFSVIALLFLYTVISGRDSLSEIVSSSGSEGLMKECSELVAENVPMRRNINELYSLTARAFGREELFGVFYDSEDGRLIKLLGGEDCVCTDDSVEAVNIFRRKNIGRPVYTMLIPTASGIYRGSLSVKSSAADQQKLMDDIYSKIDADVTPVDVWSALYSARDEYIYFRTDDRWTPLGAYSAYAATASKLGLTTYGISNYDVDYTNTEFRGALAEESGIYDVKPDTVNVYRCKYGSYIKSCDVLRTDGTIDERSSVYSKNGLRSDDKYAYFLGTVDYKTVTVKTAAEDAPRLLVIGSDYANCFLPFLAPHYSEILLADPYELTGEGLSRYADVSQYDSVLILCDVRSFCCRGGLESICY